ncbi:hypothetical protein ACQ4WX_41275 [Streptomyces lasalocidi]
MHQERALAELLDLLDVGPEPGRDDGEHFLGAPASGAVLPGVRRAVGRSGAGRRRDRTVTGELPVHSVHCSFVRPGLPTSPSTTAWSG